MWEAIAANRRRSTLLISLMGVVLVTLGAGIGMYFATPFFSAGASGRETEAALSGAAFGAVSALAVWLILWLLAAYQGDSLLLRSAQAQQIRKSDHPQLWNVVEEMTIASGLPKMPRIYLVEDHVPNAFAVGRTPEKGAVAVTSGLLRLMNRDELQGVVAHEIAHVKNLDIRFMTLAAVLVGSVELLSYSFLRAGIYAGAARRSGRSRSGGNPYLLIFVIVLAILSPILVRLLYLACSRRREYLADASAARFTRFPDGLASALEKISAEARGVPSKKVSGSLAPLYIVNPLQAYSGSGWLSTHPPAETRIRILRSMGGRAGYVDYEAALQKIEGRKMRLAALEAAAKSEESLAAREPSKEKEVPAEGVERARAVADLLDRFAGYALLPCVCGMRIKVPPEFQRDTVECPRCQRKNPVPKAEPVAEDEQEAPLPEAEQKAGSELQYQRRDNGWDAFRCNCGQTIQLGPDFPLDYTVCAKCNRRIELKRGPQTPSATKV